MVVARVGGLGGGWGWGRTAQADLRAGDYGITSGRHEVLNSESPEFLCAI